MKPYLVALGIGLLVGAIYSLLSVRSPAPPVVALLGLFGILLGEQIVPVARHMIAGCSFREAIGRAECKGHVLGSLPSNTTAERPAGPQG